MSSYPPLLMTSDPGSFAHHTIVERKPQIIGQLVRGRVYPPPIVRDLEALREEMAALPVQPLREAAPDTLFWHAEVEAWAGRTWLDVGWFFAEAYFYRRLLEAVRYFQPGPECGRDPFAAQKRSQETAAVEQLAQLWEELPQHDAETTFELLLHSCLWSNRADLSNVKLSAAAQGGLAVRAERENVLIDHTEPVRRLLRRGLGEVHWLADNAGTDVLFDLALLDFLLGQGWVDSAVLHLKPQPFYVSDAMPEDVVLLMGLLEAAPAECTRGFGTRLQAYRKSGRLALRSHPFWTSCHMYSEIPQELCASMNRADLVVLKGDLNYRRLLGDRHWPHTARVENIVAYFPAPCLVVRTLKSEIMVGLGPGQAEALAAEDPSWLVDGRRGVIQLVER